MDNFDLYQYREIFGRDKNDNFPNYKVIKSNTEEMVLTTFRFYWIRYITSNYIEVSITENSEIDNTFIIDTKDCAALSAIFMAL